MKSIYGVFIFSSLALLSCSTHYYKKNGSDVTLYLKKPEARQVELYNSLDGYAGQKLNQRKGTWNLTLPADKTFRYFYIADDEIFLPACPLKERDDFGAENCIFDPQL